MSDKSLDICNKAHSEDISTGVAGTAIITQPAVVWTLILSYEGSGTVVVNFSDDSATYSNTHRCLKMVITGPATEWNGYGKGLPLTRGLCATANGGDVDIDVVYD